MCPPSTQKVVRPLSLGEQEREGQHGVWTGPFASMFVVIFPFYFAFYRASYEEGDHIYSRVTWHNTCKSAELLSVLAGQEISRIGLRSVI